jgi:formylglycine-generating enzyme required for sulfatase activity
MPEPESREWIKVPKRYRVTKVEQDRYDLESTLPLSLEFGKLADLGPGLRVESKGWGTGAYRVYRVSTEPLGDPAGYEPELVHIPGGEFWMPGQVEETNAETSRQVDILRKVYLDDYWIGRYPVTVAQFALFVVHHGYSTAEEEKFGSAGTSWRQPYHRQDRDIREYARHPVTTVGRADAQAYCRWLTEVTGRAYGLPTQAQWEKAARGTDGRKYPWGDEKPDRTLCNVEHWFGGTTPVGQFSPAGDGPKFGNAYGCADLIGNVAEWTADSHSVTYTVHPDCDPDYWEYRTRTYYVTCGASWRMRGQCRSDGQRYGHVSDDIGFRVVVLPSTKVNRGSRRP